MVIAPAQSNTARKAESDLNAVQKCEGVFIYRPTASTLVSQLFDKIEERSWIDWFSHVLVEPGI